MTYKDLMTCDLAKYKASMERFIKYRPNLFINYWTEKTANAMTIRSWITRKRTLTGKNPDLIIVDYDDCLLPIKGESDDMYEDAGQIYSDLIGVADYFKCPLLTFAQPKREAWEKANNGNMIYSYDLAHSARKAHRCYSISSINFKEGSSEGVFYLDIARRGSSGVKIKIRRDLERGLFQECEGTDHEREDK